MRLSILFLTLIAAITVFAAGLAGTYKGTWSGSGNGDFSITLTQVGDDWKADITFTLGGETVKTKVTSIKVEGSKVTISYQFDLQGNALESTITGELKGTTLAGDYHTKSVADGSAVDDGTWKTTGQ
jgi:hypothetical protein